MQIIGKTYDEVLTSKFVAYFLDECNTNREILKQILINTKKDNEQDFVELLEFGNFENVETEVSITQQSRLDIFIKYSNFWVVIENKVWAWESKENQTSIYEKHINLINHNKLPVKYIYLKPNYNNSKPSNNNFTEFYYSDLIEIFKKINMNELQDKENYLYL